MAHSINFNSIDLSAYNLIVTAPGLNRFRQRVSRIQLQDKGYPFSPMKEPRSIKVACSVSGTSRANLDSNLDELREVLTLTLPAKLIFDIQNTRYFNAIMEAFNGDYLSPILFKGSINFICPDPLGYSTIPTEKNHSIEAAVETIVQPITGTGMVNPVYVLTAREDLDEITIILENETTDEELQWTGILNTNDYLTIDVPNWIVKKGVDVSMASVTGQFPRLKPGNNSLKISELYSSVAGDLDITFENTYL